MTPHALLFTLAAIGVSETVYLIKKRIAGERPVCVLGKECHRVLESKYSKIFGISNEDLGLVFYIAISVLTAFLVIGFEPIIWWARFVEIFILGGVILSMVSIYLQWKIIKAWCFWCLMSAFTIFLMGLIILTSNLILVI